MSAAGPVGLITGTGLYELPGLEGARARTIDTAHGPAEVVTGAIDGVAVAHIARHGRDHARLSHQVGPRANIAALRRLGAVCAVATTVCGAVDPALRLGDLIVFDDLHFPSNRLADGSLCTLFADPADPGRGHWVYERPFSAGARARLLEAARGAPGVRVRDGGVYGHVDGPRFNTRSEIAALAAAGVSAVSQTAGPEVVLAGEARLPFALLGFITDHANGVGEPTPPATVERMFRSSAAVLAGALRRALPTLARPGPQPAGTILAL